MTLTRRAAMQTMAVLGVGPGDGGAPPASAASRSVVVVGAHPDDPESGAGGTARRLVEIGHRVTFLYLTKGEGGIPGASAEVAARRRLAEAGSACRIFGVEAAFVGQVDGSTHVDQAARLDFRKRLEALAPELVLTHWPLDLHRDHRAVAELTIDAWDRRRGAFSLLFYEVLTGYQTQTFAPDVYVDIGPVLELKREGVFAHQSQDPVAIWAHHQKMHEFRGMEALTPHAEAFVHHRPSPVSDLLAALAPRPR